MSVQVCRQRRIQKACAGMSDSSACALCFKESSDSKRMSKLSGLHLSILAFT